LRSLLLVNDLASDPRTNTPMTRNSRAIITDTARRYWGCAQERVSRYDTAVRRGPIARVCASGTGGFVERGPRRKRSVPSIVDLRRR
jgi:hypothetical protein